jgi:drug/metabolite transporter (DMT)-like permease
VHALVLAFGASVAWGASDFAGGLVTQQLPLRRVLLGAELGGLVVAALAWLLGGGGIPSAGALAIAAAAGAIGLLGFACLYRGLAQGAMGVVAPLAALGAVVPVALSVVRGESLAVSTALGGAVALMGSAACAREAGSRHASEGALLGLGAAVCFGAFFAALGTAAGSGDGPAVVTVSRVSAVAILLLAGAAHRGAGGGGSAAVALAGVGTLDAVADLGFAAACVGGVHAGPSVVASLYPLTTVLLARIVLREHLARDRWVGVSAVLTGIALISAG